MPELIPTHPSHHLTLKNWGPTPSNADALAADRSALTSGSDALQERLPLREDDRPVELLRLPTGVAGNARGQPLFGQEAAHGGRHGFVVIRRDQQRVVLVFQQVA